MANNPLDGLDMRETLAWYEQQEGDLLRRVPKPALNTFVRDAPVIPLTQRGGTGAMLTHKQVLGVISRFPRQAKRRMMVQEIMMSPPLWFSMTSVPGNFQATNNFLLALSPTAIVPSMVDFEPNTTNWCGYHGIVLLYDISPAVATLQTRQLVHMQGLCHELAHCIVTPELLRGCNLLFSGHSDPVDSDTWFTHFSDLVNQSAPISHYASAYCGEDGKLLEGSDPLTPINEALVECITALLLGFAFRMDGTGLDPFAGRKELRQAVWDYLRARRVP